MELKPMMEKNEILYPTMEETSKYNIIGKMSLASENNVTDQNYIEPRTDVTVVAVPAYAWKEPVGRAHFIALFLFLSSIIIAIISTITLLLNKVNINDINKKFNRKLIEQKKQMKKLQN